MDAPEIRHAASRPEREGDHRTRQQVRIAVLHQGLSVRHRPRRGRRRRGRRRQSLPRLRRRYCRELDRCQPPRSRQGDHRAGAEVHPHVRDGLLLRAAGPARGGARRDRADSRATCGRFLRIRAPRRPKRRSSWRAITRSVRESSRSSGRFTGGRWVRCLLPRARPYSVAALARSCPGVYHAPLPGCLPWGRRRCGRGAVPVVHRRPALHPSRLSRRSLIRRRRAHPGGGRISGGAAGLPAGTAGADERSTAFCSWSTKCSLAWAGPARCSRRITSG